MGRPLTTALAFALALALAAAGAEARMYQWVSPTTGTVQLSGEPPPWYRSGAGGPRVQVFDDGNLVDDTAIELPRAQAEALREDAFREARQRQRAEALERLERAARREERLREERERLAQARRAQQRERAVQAAAATEQPPDAAGGPAQAAAEGVLDEETVARLKAIIAEFDRRGGAAGTQ